MKKSHETRNSESALVTSLIISVIDESLPLKHVFRIARGSKTHAHVIVVSISDGNNVGWAEAVPYARYNESIETVKADIAAFSEQRLTSDNLTHLIATLQTGSARNALDCAWWDLQAKQANTSVEKLLQLHSARPCVTAQTLSIDTPEAMAIAVAALNNPPLVKVKLDNDDIIAKMTAIQRAAPNSQFIVDANEGWTMTDLSHCHQQLKRLNVVLIEQPLPAGQDHELINFVSSIPLCADESCHTREELDYLVARYQVINIKLDKTGGLTEAIELMKAGISSGFDIMLGCMVGSSLSMAPIALLVNDAKYIDLDGPLLLSKDRDDGFKFEQGQMQPLDSKLWGGPNTYKYLIDSN